MYRLSPTNKHSLVPIPKDIIKRLGASTIIGVFLFTQIVAVLILFISPTASAFTAEDRAMSQNRELVFDFIDACSSGSDGRGKVLQQQEPGLDTNIKDSDGQSGKMFSTSTGSGGNGSEVPISNIFGDSNNKRNCSNLATGALKALYGSITAFFTDSGLFEGKNDGKWKVKPAYGDSGVDGNVVNSAAIVVLRRQAQSKGYYTVSDGGQYPSDTYAYRHNVLSGPFNTCFQKDSQETDADAYFTLNGPDGKPVKYSYKGGKGDKVAVGPILDRESGTFDSNDGDGSWSCQEFLKNINTSTEYFQNGYINLTDAQTAGIENTKRTTDTSEDKINDVFAMFDNNNARLKACLTLLGTDDAKSILPGLDSQEIGAAIYTTVASWLVGHPKDAKPPAIKAGSSTIVSADKTVAFRSCLIASDGYGKALTDILGREPELIKAGDLGGDSATASAIKDDNSCEAKGGVLSWIECALINVISGAISWMETVTQQLLAIPRDQYNDSMYQAWATFKNIALVIMVALMLVMVIGTAIGGGVFDAYTVKKALPRMVIGIGFILMSWWICMFAITATNIVGTGINGVVTAPFKCQYITQDPTVTPTAFTTATPAPAAATPTTITDCGQLNLSSLFGADGLTGAMSAIAVGPMLIGFIAFIALYYPILLVAMLVGFSALVLRQILIIMCVLLAPIAILSWIFPNNNKLWKFWWETFSKMLIVFPIIMLLLAAGKIFAFIVMKG